MKLLLTTLLAILGFYVLFAVIFTMAVLMLGGTWEAALKVGFLFPYKLLGWL